MLKPLDDRLIVELPKPRTRTAGGLYLPAESVEAPKTGRVIARGPGRFLENGERQPLSVRVGDEVVFLNYAGTDIEHDGDKIKILREADVLAIVSDQ
ncbi:co-chaperone GroES [Anatilimnocola floriformis]|uniref:co-chaperone GroES n=1 Tax=Anatilimnocola floriformis TaxID=2948575 RepID=UPI0020C59C47|nr:co-chaperone GroES [Anatilimnocola floriformis]